MNCTIREHDLWWNEIIFSQVPWWQIVDVPEDTVKLLQECELEKVQDILNSILWTDTH